MVRIKTQTYWSIVDFCNNRNRAEMQGDKLKALYTLIQRKGEPIKSNDDLLNGLKALQISECEYVAIKRTGRNETFYPCVLKTILLTSLNA